MEDKGLTFDKFMDDILLRENREQKYDAKDEELPPMLALARRRRENPGNLIRFGKRNK